MRSRNNEFLIWALLVIAVIILWFVLRDKLKLVTADTTNQNDLPIINRYISNNIPVLSDGAFYKEITLTNVTYQTFTHTAGRYVNALVIVNNQAVNVLVSYPSIDSVRIESNTPITGKLILT